MSKKKSILVSAAGWISNLVDKIVGALRKHGFSDEEIHALVMENGKELLDKIVDAIAEAMKQIRRIYAVLVDFGLSLEELVKLGKYDWSNPDITSAHFPTRRKGKVETEIEFFHFDRNISSEEAIREMDKAGYRPAEAHELLAFGAKYPDVQREFPIAALGSVWQYPDGDRYVVCLYEYDAERRAVLSRFEFVWYGIWRFAAVRK